MILQNRKMKTATFLLCSHFLASAEPVIIESSPIHFGDIQYDFGASCDLTPQATLSGACEDTDGTVAVAEIIITNLNKSERVLVTLNGSNNGILQFVPTGQINNGKGGTKTILNGQSIEVVVKGSGADLNLTIYGQIQAVSGNNQSATLAVDYTVEAITL